jgi:hypothetical protein
MEAVVVKQLRILDFDIETRLVGFHYGGKFSPAGCEPIAIATSWVGEKPVEVVTLGESSAKDMLLWFRGLYDQADVVTGHYIRKFDLPILNGALFENKLKTLSKKLTVDTKNDFVKRAGFSLSQENLAAMLQLEHGKFHMSDNDWRAASRGVNMRQVKKRVVADVKQHKLLREELVAMDALTAPKMWRP